MQRCITSLAFLFLISCKGSLDRNAFPIAIELEIIDSVKVEEKNYFLNGQFQVQMIGDSLIGVSSYKTPSVAFYHVSGVQRNRIASGDYPIGSFLPSAFDASEYPVVHVLDKKSESIFSFNVEQNTLLSKIKLNIPIDKEIKIMGSKFQKFKDGFLVELASSKYEQMDPKFYKESGKLIYIFDDSGETNRAPFLEFPDEIKNLNGSLRPIDYLKSSINQNSQFFTFPHTRKLMRFDINDFGEKIEEIYIPDSRFFNFDLKAAEKIYSLEARTGNTITERMTLPTNDYFNSIHETSRLLLIQTWMIDQEKNNTSSHIMAFDKTEKQWMETTNPKNILDIGMLAGVVNDTLYFYEGSLMKHDEKYIKRAILKPID